MTTLGAEMPALGEMPVSRNQAVAQRAAGRRSGRLAALLKGAATVSGTVVVIVLLVATIGPRLLPYRTFTVLSGSMEPTIPVGSMIFDREVDASKLARGDVITFHPPGQADKLVSHRIVRVEETKRGSFLVTRGDSNGVADDWRIPAEGKG
ncbi:MAG TPA: signal peptidase I, partial [Actinomycetota bacterium]|nr:signal peptidase I [Actinomycetota bacterium]